MLPDVNNMMNPDTATPGSPNEPTEKNPEDKRFRISIQVVQLIVLGLSIAIIAIVTVAIKREVASGILKDVGKEGARDAMYLMTATVEEYFRSSYEVVSTFSGLSTFPGISLPTDNHSPHWHRQWFIAAYVMVSGRDEYRGVTVAFADDSIVRLEKLTRNGNLDPVPREGGSDGVVSIYGYASALTDPTNRVQMDQLYAQNGSAILPQNWISAFTDIQNKTATELVVFSAQGVVSRSTVYSQKFTPAFLEVEVGDNKQQEPFLQIGAALANESKALLGYAAVKRSLRQVVTTFTDAAHAFDMTAFVVDENGFMIMSSTGEKVYSTTTYPSPDVTRSRPYCAWGDIKASGVRQTCRLHVDSFGNAALIDLYYDDIDAFETREMRSGEAIGETNMFFMAVSLDESVPTIPMRVYVLYSTLNSFDALRSTEPLAYSLVALSVVIVFAISAFINHLLIRSISDGLKDLRSFLSGDERGMSVAVQWKRQQLERSEVFMLNKSSGSKGDSSSGLGVNESAFCELDDIGYVTDDLMNTYYHNRSSSVGHAMKSSTSSLSALHLPPTIVMPNTEAHNAMIGLHSLTSATSNAPTSQLSSHHHHDRLKAPPGSAEGGTDPSSSGKHDSQVHQKSTTIDTHSLRKHTKTHHTAPQQELNTFNTRKCTVLSLDVCNLPDEVTYLSQMCATIMEAFVTSVVEFGGIIERMTPSRSLASWNAHNRCIQHEQRAFGCCRKMHELLKGSPFHVSLAMDTTQHFIGRVGYGDHGMYAIFGEGLDILDRLHGLSRSYLGSGALFTDRVVSVFERLQAEPVDVLVPFWTQPSRRKNIIVYEIKRKTCRSAARALFSALMKGQYDAVESCIEAIRSERHPEDERILRHISTACGMCRAHNRPTYGRIEVPMFETLGNTVLFPFQETLQQREDVETGEIGAAIREAVAKNQITEIADDGLFPVFVSKMSSEEENADNDALDDKDTTKADNTSELLGELPGTVVDLHDQEWVRSPESIGQGAFSVVHKGIGPRGTYCAMKFQKITVDTDAADLENELDHLSKLNHENLVAYYSCAVTKSYLIFMMEYVPAGTIRTLADAFGGKIPVKILKRNARDILSGLAHLHRFGVLHCDLKPDNVLVTTDGACKLCDFGSALGHHTQETYSDDYNKVRGTAAYMPPEVAKGDSPSHKGDIWSFGVMMIELATGALPWTGYRSDKIGEGRFIEKLIKDETLVPRIPPELEEEEPDLCEMIRGCVRRDEEDRSDLNQILASPFFL